MTALALGLLGVACSDLVAGPALRLAGAAEEGSPARQPVPRRARGLQTLAGVAAVLVGAWLVGMVGADPGAALVVLGTTVLLVVGWQVAALAGQQRPWVPLTVFAIGLPVLIALGDLGAGRAGPLQSWVAWAEPSSLAGVGVPRLLLVLALLAAQLSTANVVVRLVLRQVDINPPATDDRNALQGGRVLGPMERLLILGLGLAGQVTAASIVIAAKGLIRWPEISRARATSGPERPFSPDPDPPSIHDVTEYFLVGSFASWLFALGSLVLALLS